MCLYPKLIKNPKYKATKKNNGIIPIIKDERVTLVPIGCGQCKECRKQKSREWQIRLHEDIKTNKNAKFVTLTLSSESYVELMQEIKDGSKGYDLDNAIITLAVRRFCENHRSKYGKSIRHWLVTELGHKGTENIHAHGILWTDEKLETIEKIWGYGYMWKGKEENEKVINYVSNKTINYITKYVTKVDEKHKTYKAKILTSAGIGNNYTKTYNSKLNKYKEGKTIETYKSNNGYDIALPIYWRNKIYSEEEREKLWIEKLDKQERWIWGEKISIKNGEKNYYKTLEYYQKINTQLGYGSDKVDWEREQYERERRILKQKERIKKVHIKNNKIKTDLKKNKAHNKKKTNNKHNTNILIFNKLIKEFNAIELKK